MGHVGWGVVAEEVPNTGAIEESWPEAGMKGAAGRGAGTPVASLTSCLPKLTSCRFACDKAPGSAGILRPGSEWASVVLGTETRRAALSPPRCLGRLGQHKEASVPQPPSWF